MSSCKNNQFSCWIINNSFDSFVNRFAIKSHKCFHCQMTKRKGIQQRYYWHTHVLCLLYSLVIGNGYQCTFRSDDNDDKAKKSADNRFVTIMMQIMLFSVSLDFQHIGKFDNQSDDKVENDMAIRIRISKIILLKPSRTLQISIF